MAKATAGATPRQLSRRLAAKRPIHDSPALSSELMPRTASVPRHYAGWGKDSVENFVAALGTHRDKRRSTFYAFPLTLTRVELENMFRSSWLAKRIVRTPADDMIRAGWDRDWDAASEDEASNSLKAIEVAEKQFGVRGKLNEGLSWGRLYGGAGIVMDVKGQEDWSLPLRLDAIKKGDLRALHVFDRWRLAATGELDYDRGSPNYGHPKFYTLADSGQTNFRVHWSRIVKFQGEPLPWFLWIQNAYWQDSVLQHISDVIKDFDATMAGIASMVYEANVDIVKSPGLAGNLAQGGVLAQNLIDRYAMLGQMKSINHMMLLDGGDGMNIKGEEYQQKTTQFAGLKDVVEKFMINVCGAADIPMTRLFGQSPAGLTATGESDIRNYYDRLNGDQERQLRPAIERIDEVLFRSVLGAMPKNYSLKFRPLWQMTDKEKAEIEKLRAERDQIYILQGVIPEHVPAQELLDLKTYRTLTQKDVDLVARMAAMAAALPPAGVPGQTVPGGKKAPMVGLAQKPLGGGPVTPAKPAAGNQKPPEQEAQKDALVSPPGTTGRDAAILHLVRVIADRIKKTKAGWMFMSEEGKPLGGPYKSKKELAERIAQVEWFATHKK